MPGHLDVIADTWKISIDGTPLSEAIRPKVAFATVDNSLALPDLAVVELDDPGFQLMGTNGIRVGSSLKIEVTTTHESISIFVGEITALDSVFDVFGSRSVLRGYDKTHRLLRGRRTKAWIQMTYSDIITELANEMDIPLGAIDDTSQVFQHVTQAAVEDWHFMRKLADAVGYRLAMVDGQLEFTKPIPPVETAPGTLQSSSLTTYCPGDAGVVTMKVSLTDAGSATDVTVSGFDPVQKQRITGTASDPRRLNAALAGNEPGGGVPFGEAMFTSPWTPTDSQTTVTDAARNILDRIASRGVEVHAEVVGNPLLRPGSEMTIGGMGSRNGTYVISATRHVWDQHSRGYRTFVTVSDRQDRSMLGSIEGGDSGRSAVGTISGIVTGVVTNNQDTDGGMSRVKLKFPWLSDDFESDWARTTQLGAGKNRGFQILPEVEDEVLVAFEQGDVNRPFVIGGLHNGVDRPPSDVSEIVRGGQVIKRRFTSRTGHLLSFDDDDGSMAGIIISTGDGQTKIALSGGDDGVTIESTKNVVVNATGSAKVTVTAGSTVNVKSTSDMTLESGGDFSIKAPGGTVNVEGMSVAVKGTAGAQVDAGGGIAQIKGSMVQLN